MTETIKVTPKERDTILAALRLAQVERQNDGAIWPCYEDIATNAGEHEPCTDAEIEAIIKRIQG